MRSVHIIAAVLYLAAIILPAFLGLWLVSASVALIGVAGLAHMYVTQRRISILVDNQLRLIERVSAQLDAIGEEIDRISDSRQVQHLEITERPGPEIIDVVQKVIELENRMTKMKAKEAL